MIIDFHTHAFPDLLAERAMGQLAPAAGDHFRPRHDGTLGDLLRLMDDSGVDRAVVASIATKPAQAAPILVWSAQIASDRIIPFASVHPADPDAVVAVRRIARAGLHGLKLHPYYQQFAVDEPRLDPIYGAAADCGLVVLLHAGYDVAFPRDPIAAPAATARVLQRHPRLKLVAAHLGAWMDWPAVCRDLMGLPCWLDLSATLEFLPPDEAARMIRSHGTDRILFGTDAPWFHPAQTLDRLDALGLTPNERDSILHLNAERLLSRECV